MAWPLPLQRVKQCLIFHITHCLAKTNQPQFFRVDKRIQQRFDFHFALFVTKCPGVHLLVACYAVLRPVPRASHRSLGPCFSRAAVVLAFSLEYREVLCLHIAIFIAHCYSFYLWLPIGLNAHLFLNLLIVQCRSMSWTLNVESFEPASRPMP